MRPGARVKLSESGRDFYIARGTYRLDRRGTLVKAPYLSYTALVVKVREDGNKTPQSYAASMWEPITEEEKCFV